MRKALAFLREVSIAMAEAGERALKGVVYLSKAWVEETGSSNLFQAVNISSDSTVLVVPVTKFDISDSYFVEIVFWPRALENHPMKWVKALVPKHAVIMVLDIKGPDVFPTLGYKVK